MAKAKWPKLPYYLIPLFGNAYVYLCRTEDEWRQACENMGCPHDDLRGMAGCTQTYHDEVTGKVLYLLGVYNGEIATLVHECAHVAFYVCRDTGVTTRPEDANETYCYLLDRMFSHFLPYIKQE